MKTVIALISCLFLISGCQLWFANLSTAAEAEVKIEPLADPILAPLPDRNGYSTLPGWSGGYRYTFDVDTQDLSRVRLFIKRKSRAGHIVKMGWERQTGAIPNFFKSGTINGASFNNTGIFFIEQEIKF